MSEATKAPARSAYRQLFADRATFGFYLVGLLARVPMGMVSLLTVLVVAQGADGFAIVGAVSGALAAGFGLISPFRARLVDRRGARSVLLSSGVAHAVVLLALWPLVQLGVHPVVLVGVGVLIGASLPPTGAVMRSAWSAMLPDEARRHAAHSAESLAVQSTGLIGPVLVAAATVTAGPGWGLVGCAVLTLATTLLLGFSPRLAAALPARPATETSAAARTLGALRLRGVLLVLPSGFFLFAAANAAEVTTVGQSVAASAPWAAGWLVAAFGIGGLIGGLAWGWRVWPGRLSVQMIVLLAPFAGLMAVLAFGLTLEATGAVLFLAGFVFPPVMTAQFSALDAFVPQEYLTESFGWLNAARQAGSVAGSVAGLAVQVYGPRGGWLIATACAVVAVVASAILPASRRGGEEQ